MKKVAIVLNTSWNIYNFRLKLLESLKDAGYDVTFVAPYDEYADKLQQMGFSYAPIVMNNKGANPIEDLNLTYQFYKIFKKEKFDIALLYTIKPNIYANFAARLLNIPTISTVTGLGTVFLNDALSSKIAKQLYKHSLKFSKQVLFQNHDDRELFVYNKLIQREKASYIPGSGIDTDRFKPSNVLRANAEPFRFLMVARLVKDKGLMEYLEASKAIKSEFGESVECMLLGEFYEGNPTAITKDELRQYTNENIVNYLGKSDEVQKLMEECDCVVLPSYREGLSRVLLEACAMQKPIITTNVPGCKDLVDNGVNGYLCEVKEVKSLQDAMKKTLSLSSSTLQEMGEFSRQKVVKNFSTQIVVKQYLDTIASILK